MSQVVLASGSVSRATLLRAAGVTFFQVSPGVDDGSGLGAAWLGSVTLMMDRVCNGAASPSMALIRAASAVR